MPGMGGRDGIGGIDIPGGKLRKGKAKLQKNIRGGGGKLVPGDMEDLVFELAGLGCENEGAV